MNENGGMGFSRKARITRKKKAQLEFIPPTSGYGQDWVLIIDDVAKNYSAPGIKK